MISDNNSQFENTQNENNEKNKVKLYLEACMRRKVEILNIHLFKERKELQKNEISYKVWLYAHDIIKDARSIMNRNNEYGNLIKQKSEVIKFKTGQIDFEEMKTQNAAYNSKKDLGVNNDGEEKEYYIVLAQAFIGKMQTHLIEEGGDVDKAISEIGKFSTAEKADCFYLCKDYSLKQGNSNDHTFAIRDPSRMVYLALVKFTTEEDLIMCSVCNEPKVDMKYCHNDRKYFCLSCDEEFHSKNNYQTIRKHKRTNYMSFSVTYQGTCFNHSLKPYEFYCFNCKAIYCIKCLMDGDHNTNLNHDVRYLTEIIGSIDQESKSLIERVKQINSAINKEMDEKEKNAREIQKTIQLYETSLYERKRKAIQELDNETLYRSTYLASVYIELQRQISEIDSKISFLRNQYYNADNSTYINMINVFNKYMKEDVFHNIEMLVNLNLDNITQPFHKIDQKDRSEMFAKVSGGLSNGLNDIGGNKK